MQLMAGKRICLHSFLMMKSTFILSSIVLFGLLSLAASCNLPQSQYDALESFYNETNGGNWHISSGVQWTFPSSVNAPCTDDWAGITCTCSQQTNEYGIVELSLSAYDIAGIISPAIGNLTYLQTLDLSDNYFIGTIPSEIGNLSSLLNLNLYTNRLTRTIPSEIGRLTSLQYMYLGYNYLTGPIPSEIGRLSMLLESLSLYYNYLSGSIPTEIGLMSSLQSLDLSANQLTGPIPSEIGQLSLLQYMWLSTNKLAGSIPAEIGLMSSLRFLSLCSNQLTSLIPPEIGQLSSLVEFYLCINQMAGSIPPEIGNLSSLQYLDLNTNLLAGPIPPEIGQLSQLQTLDLSANLLIGSIPTEVVHISVLHRAYLNSNQLAGSIPSQIGQLTSLEILRLSSNKLSGTIPPEISLLSRLSDLFIDSNQLTGTIPSEISPSSGLAYLDLHSNRLTGSIPSTIFQLSSLQILYLDSNQLTGTIPSEIGNLSLCEYLDLYDNQLTGTIPTQIGLLSSLSELLLFSNLFSGSIPPSCDLPGLQFLYLYKNALTSSIPPCFGQLSNLVTLALQSNYLSSTIPASLSGMTSLVDLFLNDNHFIGTFPRIRSILSLTQLSLSNNLLSGSVFSAISIEVLITLSIANNLFSDTITDKIFSSGQLTTLLASGNCFHGSIPETVCNVTDKNMTIFDLSNSGGNELCPDNQQIQSHRPPLVLGTFSNLGLSGTIPSCLLTSTSMTALRLSGNRLHGNLPSSISSSTIKLVNLTLAYNSLTGTIPDWIQQHSFQELDLSNNRLDGTLSHDFMVSAYQTTLGLAVNRLSGDLPGRIVEVSSNMSSLNVLSGNIFACNNEELPSQDPSAESYSCGSYELYVSSYTWLGFVGSFILVGIIVRLVAYRYETLVTRFECYQQLMSWSAAVSQLFDKSADNNVDLSQAWTSRFQQLPETITFMLFMRLAPRASLCAGLILLFIALPTYVGLHAVSSIVTYDYGYIVSMAYLHNIEPVIFIGALLLILFVIVIFVVRSFLVFLSSIHSIRQSGAINASISILNSNHFAWRQYLMFFALNLINLVVVMSINIAYVNTIVNSTSYNRVELLFIQVGVGLFKVVWNSAYVPWSCDLLAAFSLHRGSIRSRYLMSIINYIVAPVVSTIVYSESCFYFVFNSAEEVSSSVSLTIQELGFCGLSSCVVSFPISIKSTTSSSFDYSYACGQALIVAYTPVLISSYLFSGFLPPASIVLAFNNHLSRFVYHLLNFQKEIPFPYRPKCRVNGRDVAVRLMVHSTVLFTFGLAAPILVIPIVFSIITDCYTCHLLVGKTLYENDVEVAVEDQSHQTTINPIVRSKDASNDTSSDDANDTSKQGGIPYKATIKADLLTMEHLDMASSYQAIDACFHLMIVFVMLFWALLFFDMIADVHGKINGIITMTCFAILPALLLIAMDKFNLILRMTSQLGLSHVIDRYLANKLGLDMNQLKSVMASCNILADNHPDPRTSLSHDVEMMVSSQMHINDRFVAEDHQEIVNAAPVEHECH
jgi:Leucine-rich repeat (LRR) protein